MPTYAAPVKDTMFVLNDVLDIGRYANLPGFANASPDLVEAILEEMGKFAAEVLQPLNLHRRQSKAASAHDDGSVTAPRGSSRLMRQFCAAGWPTLTAPEEYGGQGLPQVIGVRDRRICAVRQSRVRDVPGPDLGRDRLPAGQGPRPPSSRPMSPTW